MKIEKRLIDNDSEFAGRFIGKDKNPSGKHAFDRECTLVGIEHRFTKPRHPQTNGMVERCNGCISDVLAGTCFRLRDDLQTTIERYVKIYNDHLPQKALGHKTSLQAMRVWHEGRRLDLFVRRFRQSDGTGHAARRGSSSPVR